MDYKSLFTVATTTKGLDHVLTAAAGFAVAREAHLDVLALGVDRTQLGYSYIGTGAIMLSQTMDRAEDDARLLEKAVIKAAGAQSPSLRWAVEPAVAHLGAVTDVVAERARFADLVILPCPYAEGLGVEAEAVAEAALFNGAAPVLVLPTGGTLVARPKRIVVCWNQSREAMAAVRHALPLLREAEMVDITVVDPPIYGTERSDPGGPLCQMLVRHGVKAEVTVLARSLPRTSEVLNRHGLDMGADLMVMGAYGHSRFREAILGGATRDMLEEAKIPVLMAH